MRLRDRFRRNADKKDAGGVDMQRLTRLGDDPATWSSLDPVAFAQLVFVECVRYGIPGQSRGIDHMRQLYGLAVKTLERDERLALVQILSQEIERHHTTCNALLPVLFGDDNISVISTAALSTAVLMPLLAGDPLTGPRAVIKMSKGCGSYTTQSGALVGLLALGDRRVARLVLEEWDDISPTVQFDLASTWTGVAHAPVIDFLVYVIPSCEDHVLGAVAGTLARYPRDAHPPFVVEGARKFPANVGPEPEIRKVGAWSFEEYGKIIGPMLREHARFEWEPKVIPAVLDAWGIAR